MVEENRNLEHENSEMRLKMEKATAQMQIASVAMGAMIVVTAFLLSKYGPSVEKLDALDSAISTFYIAMASIVGAFMGFTTWLSKK